MFNYGKDSVGSSCSQPINFAMFSRFIPATMERSPKLAISTSLIITQKSCESKSDVPIETSDNNSLSGSLILISRHWNTKVRRLQKKL